MTYKVGTRVKKVRGAMLGMTGVVSAGPPTIGYNVIGDKGPTDFRYDIYIRFDGPIEAINSLGMTFLWPAGNVACAFSPNWEPIVDPGAEPCGLSYEQLLESLQEDQHEQAY